MKYPKLPKTFKKKWVAALRSGKYKQGHGALKKTEDNYYDERDTKYCCLGVACEVVGAKIKAEPSWITQKNVIGIKKVPKVLIGDDQDNPLVMTLSMRNDSGEWSFKRIATWVEKYL